MSGVIRLAISVLLILATVGCGDEKTRKKSVLLLGVESLSLENFSCETKENEDLSITELCASSIRFTHAFTPSTMSQAVWASIFTGEYPQSHGVWHNGSSFLTAQIETIPEKALHLGYKTSFFSGGPPVFQKAGIGQGFELFDDELRIDSNNLYRPAGELIKDFAMWLQDEVGDRPFFSALYFADLQFSEISTFDKAGEVRPASYEGQTEAFEEALGDLIVHLKKINRWDDTTIIIFGLNGFSSGHHSGIIDSLNLYNEVVQVPLFIKPDQEKRDLALNWNIDKNVSLVDVGVTINDIIGGSEIELSDNLPKAVSLKSVLQNPTITWDENRNILLESSWPQWFGLGLARYSIRKGHYFYLHDQKPKIFNTLVDRFEDNSIGLSDPQVKATYAQIKDFFAQNAIEPWADLPHRQMDIFEVGKELWATTPTVHERAVVGLNLLGKGTADDSRVLGWRANLALQNRDWDYLLEISKKAKNPYWNLVASRNLHKPPDLLSGSCMPYFLHFSRLFRSEVECSNELILSMHQWLIETDTVKRTKNFESFLRSVRFEMLDKKIAQMNYVNDLRWDVDTLKADEPLLIELFLHLPEMEKLRTQIEKRLQMKI